MDLGLKQLFQAVAVLGQPSSPMYGRVTAAHLSLPSAIALYLQREWAKMNGTSSESILDGVGHHLLDEVEGCALGQALPSTRGSVFRKRERELYLIRGKQDLLSDKFDFFCERFRRSLTGGRRDSGYKDLREALFEMSDNVVSHAGVTDANANFGMAAYDISDSGACFTVCDTGCGFVESLAASEKWKDIDTHQRAISAVVLDRATSRTGESSGGGFAGMFSALVQLNSVTFLRSGGCLAEILTTREGPSISFHAGQALGGSQVTVLFSRRVSPKEKFH